MDMHFDAAVVRQLLDHARAAPTRAPTLEQTFEGRCRRDGRDVDVEGLGLADWPTAADVDPARLPIGLWLVGDQGVYLMSPGRPGLLLRGTNGHVVARSEETDPAYEPDEWYENKRRAFGGDDGVVFLDAAFIELALSQQRANRMALTVTPECLATAVPASRRLARSAVR